MKELEESINKIINFTSFLNDGNIMLTNHLVGRRKYIKISLFSKDQISSYFHVASKFQSIDAVFDLYTGNFIEGVIDENDNRRIEYFYHNYRYKLIRAWEIERVKKTNG
jgi:hypothetical protein